MPKKLAFMTIGVLKSPMGTPGAQGFLDRVPEVFAAADAGHGFVDRSKRDMTTYDHSWGNVEIPQCFSDHEDPLAMPSTLSIWEDLESVAAYAYHGAHGDAMTKRSEWFLKTGLPSYVAWWVEDVDRLSRADAAERLDHLHNHGPTPFAFNFVKPFGPDGLPTTLDTVKVREKVAINKAR